MGWIIGTVVTLVVIVLVVRMLGGQTALRRIRGRPHLVEIAEGLRRMQPEVAKFFAEHTAESAESAQAAGVEPVMTTGTAGGVLIAWTAVRDGTDATHKIAVMTVFPKWAAQGFLMLYVCDRLGIRHEDVRVARMGRENTYMFATLSDSEHAELMARQIDDPPVDGLDQFVHGLVKDLLLMGTPPVHPA